MQCAQVTYFYCRMCRKQVKILWQLGFNWYFSWSGWHFYVFSFQTQPQTCRQQFGHVRNVAWEWLSGKRKTMSGIKFWNIHQCFLSCWWLLALCQLSFQMHTHMAQCILFQVFIVFSLLLRNCLGISYFYLPTAFIWAVWVFPTVEMLCGFRILYSALSSMKAVAKL